MLIDSHCHLNHARLLEIGGPDTVVARARDAGVTGMLTICCRIAEEFDDILAIARRNDGVWCSVGTHPHDAAAPAEASLSLDDLVRLARSDPKIVAIGESGLDYYYNHSPAEAQQLSFRKHIRACLETGLPLVVHARDADDDIMRIIREEGAGTSLTGVLHCFSSSAGMGEAALEFGFFISFSGIVTFKNSEILRDFARSVPLDRLLVETDAPYLAPAPERRKINEPALVKITAQQLAILKDVSEEELTNHSNNNFFRLFKQAKSE